MVRENFEDQLNELKQRVFKMSEMAKTSLTKATYALEHQDSEQAQDVINQDEKLILLKIILMMMPFG